MTPDLMEAGAKRMQLRKASSKTPSGKTEAGGQTASYARHYLRHEVDVTHGRILYLEDV
ncbi:MAG: ABC transporter ATP-binding protein, partial [Betaproteobacteria bacterium]|nr:ABC transporter ATP-binding protein [Betaproteobacteria bacterium]